MRRSRRDIRPLVTVGAAAAVLIIALICIFSLRSCSQNRKYDDYMSQAMEAFAERDWEKAEESVLKALEYGKKEEAYMLLADIYLEGMDDLDSALETLYLGYSLLGSDALSERIELLKQAKRDDAAAAELITIGDKEFEPDTSALNLSKMSLRDEDLEPLKDFERIEGLDLSDNDLNSLDYLPELDALTSLNLSGNNISDISRLRRYTSLKVLYLDDNPIEDLSPLYVLTGLGTLSITGIELTESKLAELEEALPNCRIHSDDAVAEEITLGGKTFMSDVEELDLGGLGISDISELAKCEKLKKLDLRDNSISSLAALKDLEDLEWLCVWNNSISDLSPLTNMTKLTYLDADSNRISDLTPLRGLRLTELYVNDNAITNFNALQAMTSLQRLGLKGTGASDDTLALLGTLKSLWELSLENNSKLTANGVEELQEKLPNCTIKTSNLTYTLKLGGTEYKSDATEIRANGAGISSLSGLEHFTALRQLEISNNSIGGIKELSGLTSLERLAADNCGITDISALSGHTALKTLTLGGNGIVDISALSSCTGLTELNLGKNYNIIDVSALSSCTSLTTLRLDYCGISEIDALSNLTTLTTLSLEGNNISSAESLYNLTNLKTLKITNNNLTQTEIDLLHEKLPNCNIEADAITD